MRDVISKIFNYLAIAKCVYLRYEANIFSRYLQVIFEFERLFLIKVQGILIK